MFFPLFILWVITSKYTCNKKNRVRTVVTCLQFSLLQDGVEADPLPHISAPVPVHAGTVAVLHYLLTPLPTHLLLIPNVHATACF